MSRFVLQFRLFACQFLQNLYELIDFERFMAAKIENLKPNRFQTQDCPACDIINMSESSPLFAVAKYKQWFAFNDPLNEPEHNHIRSASRAVNGKVPENGHINTVQVMVGKT